MNSAPISDLDPIWSLAVKSIIYMLVEVLEEANGNHLTFPTYLWLLSCYGSYSCLGNVVLVMRWVNSISPKWVSLHWENTVYVVGIFCGGVIFAVERDPWRLIRSCCVHETCRCYNSHPVKTVTILQVPLPLVYSRKMFHDWSHVNQPTSTCDTNLLKWQWSTSILCISSHFHYQESLHQI